ncbi:SDR family NAD(P)-dependent oxidoreductase [Pedobacter psychroterrae]|uniref:SDR family NAD(P)-dependent oxidoreductase n=1 Tax=Pedobacter psychroterrae TaxID=2530453 RepID=A0A4R0N9J0_9SPHI|nr:SDR family NAD(P)-dependent oxidoreductase [Pedobacter psychroterrae]TCC96868.1 SDR family NAD(P)-dependent oxidoreductase [Pedobacter psychroterrae]
MNPNELFNIKNKVALVTGSSGGLGAAFARGLCEHGARVILNGRNQEKLTDQVNQLRREGHQVWGYDFDINNSEQVNEAVEAISQEVGDIDILVNNAGITIRGPLESFSDADWDLIIAVNLSGAFKVSRAVAAGMIKRKSGKIINIGSLQSELGRPSITPYAASKGGLKMLTKGMAVEWAKHNIQTNGIGPGYFKTDMTKPLYENTEFNDWVCKRTPGQRWGLTEELVGALIFLSARASDYVNGQMIYVDGGLLSSV